MPDEITPEPYRSPHGWHQPTITGGIGGASGPIDVEVSFPNEDPDTEDDLTLNFAFTEEGIIVDLYVSDGEPVASFGRTYEEFADTVADLDQMIFVPPRPSTGKVAALSADLRLLVESEDEYVDDAQTMMCATDLLDAIDALLVGLDEIATLGANLRSMFDGDSNDAEHDAAVDLLHAIDALLAEEGR